VGCLLVVCLFFFFFFFLFGVLFFFLGLGVVLFVFCVWFGVGGVVFGVVVGFFFFVCCFWGFFLWGFVGLGGGWGVVFVFFAFLCFFVKRLLWIQVVRDSLRFVSARARPLPSFFAPCWRWLCFSPRVRFCQTSPTFFFREVFGQVRLRTSLRECFFKLSCHPPPLSFVVLTLGHPFPFWGWLPRTIALPPGTPTIQ